MFEHKQLEAEKFRKEQERMALYLVNHYEGVKKIEFMNFLQNSSTGIWNVDVIVNEDYYLTLNINDFGGEIDIAEHISQSGGKELDEKSTLTNEKLLNFEVKYFEK